MIAIAVGLARCVLCVVLESEHTASTSNPTFFVLPNSIGWVINYLIRPPPTFGRVMMWPRCVNFSDAPTPTAIRRPTPACVFYTRPFEPLHFTSFYEAPTFFFFSIADPQGMQNLGTESGFLSGIRQK